MIDEQINTYATGNKYIFQNNNAAVALKWSVKSLYLNIIENCWENLASVIYQYKRKIRY